MRKSFQIFVLVFLTVTVAHCGASEHENSVRVKSAATGEELGHFQVEIADEPAEQATGLMYRKELGANKGMLFLFPQDRMGAFWMLNTLIPLDIIFISADKKIVNIVERAEPQTTTPRNPTAPYRYVLEINGGRSSELGIGAGDSVEF